MAQQIMLPIVYLRFYICERKLKVKLATYCINFCYYLIYYTKLNCIWLFQNIDKLKRFFLKELHNKLDTKLITSFSLSFRWITQQ